MTILLYETVGASNFMTLWKDSEDPKLFYYVPKFSAVAKHANGKLQFGARLFRADPSDPNDGFGLYNFACSGVVPTRELQRAQADLEATYGPGVRIAPITPDEEAPTLVPLTDGVYRAIKCQSKGVDLFAHMACSFTVPEIYEPDMKGAMQTQAGWTGHLDFKVRTKKTSFKWTITANWRRIHEHFKAQVSVKKWFVNANLSYETQKLMEKEILHVDTEGGTPSQREKIYTFAEKIAGRLFVPSLEMNPMPSHPTGSAVCLSVNYQKIEEDKTSTWSGRESDYEVKSLGLAVVVGGVPDEYFSGYDRNSLLGLPKEDAWIYDFATEEELVKHKDRSVGGRGKGKKQ